MYLRNKMFVHFDEIPYVFLTAKKGNDGEASCVSNEMDDEDASVIMCAKNLMNLSSSPPDPLMRKCQICSTGKTPLWRRWGGYHTLCNACGLRERTHAMKKARYM